MLTLDSFEKELYGTAYAGNRWFYVPRAAGEKFALAIVVVGLPGETLVPSDICCGDGFDEMASYAKSLNTERETRRPTGEKPLISEVA